MKMLKKMHALAPAVATRGGAAGADGGALGASPPALNGLSRFRNGQAVVFGRWSSTRRGAYHPDKVQIVREHGYSARATCLLRDGCSL